MKQEEEEEEIILLKKHGPSIFSPLTASWLSSFLYLGEGIVFSVTQPKSLDASFLHLSSTYFLVGGVYVFASYMQYFRFFGFDSQLFFFKCWSSLKRSWSVWYRIPLFPTYLFFRFLAKLLSLVRGEDSFVWMTALGYLALQDTLLGLFTLGCLWTKSKLTQNTVVVKKKNELTSSSESRTLSTETNEEPEKQHKEEEDNQEEMEILEIGSPQATLRLLKDLRNIKKRDPKDLVLIFWNTLIAT